MAGLNVDRRIPPLARGVSADIAVRAAVWVRWIGVMGMAVVLLSRLGRANGVGGGGAIDRPVVATIGFVVVVQFTVAVTVAARRAPGLLTRPVILVVELVIAAAMLTADGWVFRAHQAWEGVALASIWPLACLIMIGTTAGMGWAAAAAVGLVGAHFGGLTATPVRHSLVDDGFPGYRGPKFVPALETGLLYLTIAVGSARVAAWLDRLWEERTSAQTLSRVASRLHDTVLQTLAVVQRRCDDPAIVRMARSSDHEVRQLLFGTDASDDGRLRDMLVDAAGETAERFGLAVEYAVVDETEMLDERRLAALRTAVREAVTNVGKHAHAERVVIYAGHDDSGVLVVSVKDDGVGFDGSETKSGTGLCASIRGPMRAVGGDATIVSRPGEGSHVRLTLP